MAQPDARTDGAERSCLERSVLRGPDGRCVDERLLITGVAHNGKRVRRLRPRWSRMERHAPLKRDKTPGTNKHLSLIHISEPTRLGMISYAVFCLKKKKK